MSGTVQNMAAAALRSRIVVFSVAVLCLGFYVIHTGPSLAVDSVTFIGWADKLAAGGFHFSAVPGGTSSSAPMTALRASFIYVLALLRLLAGRHWLSAFAALNILTTALTAAMLTALIWRVTDSAAAAGVGLVCFLGAYDVLMWIPLVLSDTMFLVLSMWVFSELSRVVSRPADRAGWIRLAAALLLAVSFRPTGVVFFAVAAAGIPLANHVRRRGGSPVRKSRLMLGSSAAFAAILVTMLAAAVVYQRPERWPLSGFKAVVHAYADDFAKGKVINDRPETYHAPPRSIAEYSEISLDRFARFFQVVVPAYSRFHNIYNILFFVPVYALAGVGISSIAKYRYREAAPTAVIAIAGLLMFATFHSVTLLDFDWRYRMPSLPFLFYLSALGAGTIADIRSRHSVRSRLS